MSKSKLYILLIITLIVYFVSNKIYVRSSSNIFEIEKFTIAINIKDCINCIWLDSDMKKKVKILDVNKERVFNLESATQVEETRIVIGKTRENSKFNELGIDWVVFFPNELEKLESFNFETGEDLNKIGDGSFIRRNYHSDNTMEDVFKDIKVVLDISLM